MNLSERIRRSAAFAPVADAVAFYRAHPIVLGVAVIIAGLLALTVLTDGGVDLGEAVAMVAIGAVIGMLYAAFGSARRSEDD